MQKRNINNGPQVSIIMPTYNRGYILNQAIQSVVRQTYTDFELIIIDDGSTDNTEDIVKGVPDLNIVYLKLEQNYGANYARNYGLRSAKGKYISFLDSDNIWNSDFLYSRIQIIEEAQTDFVFGRVKVHNSESSSIEPSEPAEDLQNTELLLKTLAFKNVIDTNTVCMRRTCYESVGGFDEKLERCQDWEYFYRILRSEKHKYQFIDNILVESTIQKDSISNSKLYWPGRLYIFNKYISDYRSKGYLSELMFLLYHQLEGSEAYNDSKEELFKYITDDEKMALLEGIHAAKKENDEYIQSLFDILHENYSIIEKNSVIIKKDNMIMRTQSKWFQLERRGIQIEKRIAEMGMKHIAIYGYGILGKQLYQVCREKEIVIEYLIDKNPEVFRDNLNVCEPISDLSRLEYLKIDLIVITTIYYFEEICQELKPLTEARLISLEELVEEKKE